jgi:membrane associated rhomboid family serine protease
VNPADHPYGYVVRRRARACTREQLIELFRRPGWGQSSLVWVWTPWATRLVPCYEVPELVDAYSVGIRRRALRSVLLLGLVIVALALLWAWWGHTDPGTFRTLLALAILFGGIGMVSSAASLLALRDSARAAMAAPSMRERIGRILASPAARTSQVLQAALWAVFVVSLVRAGGGGFVQAAGLLKDGPGREEWWRWVTVASLHGGVVHLMFNAGALSLWGTLVEACAGRAVLGLVFLVSVVGASWASWTFEPKPAVGASGGLCGLLGYLAVVAWRRRAHLPVGFGRIIADSAIATLALGVALWGTIDNAAHAGGFLAGAACGLLLVRRDGEDATCCPRLTGWLGRAAWLTLAATAMLAVVRILGHPRG